MLKTKSFNLLLLRFKAKRKPRKSYIKRQNPKAKKTNKEYTLNFVMKEL